MEFNMLLSTILLFSTIIVVNASTLGRNPSYQLVQKFDASMSKAAAPARPSKEDYFKMREELIELERKRSLGYDIELTSNEKLANEIIMKAKNDEFDNGFNNPESFNPSRHIFHVLNQVNSSKLFNYLLKMPKGAILHAHDTALMTSADYLVSYTYYEDLWECRDPSTNRIEFFKFSLSKPEVSECLFEWKRVNAERARIGKEIYDADVRTHLTLLNDDPLKEYTNINVVWQALMKIFGVAESLITYRPVFESYFERVLIQYYEDGVQYLEFRGTLPPVYEMNGTIYKPAQIVGIYKTIIDRFTTNNPDFIGAKFIYAPLKIKEFNNTVIKEFVDTVQDLVATYPTFVAGFDLVGQEDITRPIVEMIEPLLTLPELIHRFFHAGETNWYGTTSDENLFDAILMGTKRIGHGYALVKHPKLLELVKERDIAIEVNPISNQVLKLVDDYRNHPASIFFADNYPVVISSDDPAYWEVTPLTHDFYEAFLGIAARWQDLRLLKKLAINSLEYSSLDNGQKSVAMKKWQKWWDAWILDVIASETDPLVTNKI